MIIFIWHFTLTLRYKTTLVSFLILLKLCCSGFSWAFGAFQAQHKRGCLCILPSPLWSPSLSSPSWDCLCGLESPLKNSLFQLSAWGLFKVSHRLGALVIKGKTRVFALQEVLRKQIARKGFLSRLCASRVCPQGVLFNTLNAQRFLGNNVWSSCVLLITGSL